MHLGNLRSVPKMPKNPAAQKAIAYSGLSKRRPPTARAKAPRP